MPRPKLNVDRTCPEAFRHARDALDVVGRWEWEAATDSVRSDAFVALLFNVDPAKAETGISRAAFQAAIHPEDRERILGLIRQCAQEGRAYVTEYRVIAFDGQTRWVLARARFSCDQAGQPLRGSGMLVDITHLRMAETTSSAIVPRVGEAPLDRAAEHAIAAQRAIVELQDPELKVHADTLLMALGRKLAGQEVRNRRRHMN